MAEKLQTDWPQWHSSSDRIAAIAGSLGFREICCIVLSSRSCSSGNSTGTRWTTLFQLLRRLSHVSNRIRAKSERNQSRENWESEQRKLAIVNDDDAQTIPGHLEAGRGNAQVLVEPWMDPGLATALLSPTFEQGHSCPQETRVWMTGLLLKCC